MLLDSKEGVYSDFDTGDQESLRDWVKQEWRSEVPAIRDNGYDQLDGEPYTAMTERLQLCQWTIAASRGHHIMKKEIEDVMKACTPLPKAIISLLLSLSSRMMRLSERADRSSGLRPY